jgi:serine/threonine-protein kinase SRK2
MQSRVDPFLPQLPSMLLGDKYHLVEELGRGSFGAVYKAYDLTDLANPPRAVAVKIMPRGQNVTQYVVDEFVNHRNVSFHPHVISFKEAFLTDDYLCLVMEYATRGTLLDYIRHHGNLEEDVARRFFQQLILGVDFCHRKGVALRCGCWCRVHEFWEPVLFTAVF